MGKHLIGLIFLMLAAPAFAQTQCPSYAFTSYDFNNQYEPLQGRASVPSAYAGQRKEIAVIEDYSGQLCRAYVSCNYYAYWQVDNVICGGGVQTCPATAWTVYDLG